MEEDRQEQQSLGGSVEYNQPLWQLANGAAAPQPSSAARGVAGQWDHTSAPPRAKPPW